MRVALFISLTLIFLTAGCGRASEANTSAGSTAASTASTTETTVEGTTSRPATTASPPPASTTAGTTTVAPPPPTPATTAVETPTQPAPATTVKPSSPVTEQSVCPSEQGAGIIAVFGHRRTRSAALALATKARSRGFTGLTIQQRGCHDYAAVLPFIKNYRQALELRKEAAPEGFKVRIDCRSHPVEGGLAAVFGHRRTRAQALALRARAAKVGFQNLEVQQDRCNDWEVDLYGIMTPSARKEFTAEALGAGFRIVYELG